MIKIKILVVLAVIVLIITLGVAKISPKAWLENLQSIFFPIDTSKETVVLITPQGFEPQFLTIKPGQQVRFINSDSKPHRPSAEPYPSHQSLSDFDSLEPLGSEESFAFIFDSKGIYHYTDHLNPVQFKGTIVVE